MPDPPLPQRARQIPAAAQDEIRGAYWAIFDTDALTAAGTGPGTSSSPRCRPASTPSPSTYGTLYPPPSSACSPTGSSSPATCGSRLEHHKRIRHSNFIERTFGETRRRVKVIGRLPGETSCLNLVWAVLDRAAAAGAA